MTVHARPRSAAKLPGSSMPASALLRDGALGPRRRERPGDEPRPTPKPSGDRRRQASPRNGMVIARPLDAAAVPRPTPRELASGQSLKGPARERHEADPWIVIGSISLVAVGVLMIYSARIPLSSDPAALSLGVAPELAWVTLGILAMFLMSRLDYRWLRVASVPLFLVSIALLVVVLLPPIGFLTPVRVGDSARWLKIGGLQSFHPAEIAKLALVVYLAHWLTRRGSTTGSLFRGTIPFLCIAGCVIALVAMEPDLGTTGVITLTAFAMFFVAGASLWQLGIIVPAGLFAVWAYIQSNAYQLDRWHTFQDPWAVAGGDGYQTVQGLLALGLGGPLGQGLGSSHQAGSLRLPNADNDFVFAMVGQELGFVGGAIVIGMFLILAWRGIRVGLRAPDTFGGLLAIGISSWLAFQAFINIGVAVHLLPLTGITLPFVSSGNSSLLVSFAAVGILLSISREIQTQPRGTSDDADPGRGRGHWRPHLPGARGPATPGVPPARP